MTSSSSSDIDSDDDSEYIPTPLRLPQRRVSPTTTTSKKPVDIPNNCVFLDLSMVDEFVKQINHTRGCKTAGCHGKLVPRDIMTHGMGGTATIMYMCDGCQCVLDFQTSTKNTRFAKTDIKLAAQVAFIAAGCTYTTYCKVLQQVLGIKAVCSSTFMMTIEMLYPIVKEMVDDLCEREKRRMKEMDPQMLGSWKQAVTSADGTWMTRGFHSKNATFSIRNYYTGALLYFKHICQKGNDFVIDEELYKGTSKSAEGYAARQLFQIAKKEGLDIAIHWQDADSSSSKSVEEIFPRAKVMICGGHAGRAHLKQLKSLAKKKTFTKKFKDMYRDEFPEVDNIKCECTKHKAGCGCLSDIFCQRARNNFSSILSDSNSSTEFSERLLALVHHVQDVHQWDGGQCQFHALTVCSCGKCAEKNEHQCQGKEYHTREVVTCPFHLLVYEIECHKRAKMADKLVHPILKRGHSNWLESSHSVFIRFRPKHIFLERLHYHVATNLGLLQANLTNEYNQQGPAYHWKLDLLQRLNLPVYDGVGELLERLNRQRKKALDRIKTTKAKKRRVELKTLRTQEAQQRKLWSKQHGHDTYGDEEADTDKENEENPRDTKGKTTKKPCNKCGSKTHSRSTHKECPYNKKKNATAIIDEKLLDITNDQTTEKDTAKKGTTVPSTNRESQHHTNTLHHSQDYSSTMDSMDELHEHSEDKEDSDGLLSYNELDVELLEDSIINGCTCGALNKAHKKTCPMNSRTCYKSQKVQNERLLKPGDYVRLHSNALKNEHICCRVVEQVQKSKGCLYRLCCITGVLQGIYPETDLTKSTCSAPKPISLDRWRTKQRITLTAARSDQRNLQLCACQQTIRKETIDLTDVPVVCSQNTSKAWIQTSLYTLYESDQNIIISPFGWLNDRIITASQKLLAQHFPGVAGLQTPVLEQINGFQAHKGTFVQIVNVNNKHWILVSDLGCDNDHTVFVYDTMYDSLPESTEDTIARLAFCSYDTLTIKMIEVDMQKNTSDCGVLCVAIALDIMSAGGPIIARYDSKLLRDHLRKCLFKCCLEPFPVIGDRSLKYRVKNTINLKLFCICRRPEREGEEMAECEGCGAWYHKVCLNIPDAVFDEEIQQSWKCQKCTNTQ